MAENDFYREYVARDSFSLGTEELDDVRIHLWRQSFHGRPLLRMDARHYTGQATGQMRYHGGTHLEFGIPSVVISVKGKEWGLCYIQLPN